MTLALQKNSVLYKDETLRYISKRHEKTVKIVSEKMNVKLERDVCPVGKFGQLNAILDLNEEEKKRAMEAYQQEEEIAGQIFQAY